MTNIKDNISTIQHLRSSIYPEETFKTNFSKQLSKKLCAKEVSYIPEQFGGWNVNVVINQDKRNKLGKESTSESYYPDVMDCLLSSIKLCEHVSYSQNIAHLANVVISGADSLIIKI